MWQHDKDVTRAAQRIRVIIETGFPQARAELYVFGANRERAVWAGSLDAVLDAFEGLCRHVTHGDVKYNPYNDHGLVAAMQGELADPSMPIAAAVAVL